MSETKDAVRAAFGWALTVLGVLWLLVTGGCTAFSFYLIIAMAGDHGALVTPSDFVGLLVLIVIAVLIIAPGAGLLWGGRALRKR